MNILILSAGTRNKIVQYFRKALAGRGLVIAADCTDIAPAIYDADRFHIVPAGSEVASDRFRRRLPRRHRAHS